MKRFASAFKSVLLALVILAFENVQAEGIDSLKISPLHPHTQDTIRCIAYLNFGSEPNTIDSFRIVQQGQHIEVFAYYQIGGFTHPVKQSDTFSIGLLPPGEYTLNFHLYASSQVNELDEDSIKFDVLEWNGIRKETSQIVSIFPNPTDGFIRVLGAFRSLSLELYNGVGVCVMRSSGQELYVAELPSGIYTVLIRDDEGKYYARKFTLANALP